MNDMSGFFLEDGLKLALSVLLGGVIGLEREASDKPAGLRTNILICLGSTLMMILSIQVAHHYAVNVADPSRIAQGLITGIGFLGAGTILHSRGGVIGLTTAATTWSVAGIGMAVGSGFYLLAFITTVLILLVLFVLGKLAHQMPNGKASHTTLRLVAEDPIANVDGVRSVLEKEGVGIIAWSYRRLRHGHSIVVECDLPRQNLPVVLARISSSPGVRSARSL